MSEVKSYLLVTKEEAGAIWDEMFEDTWWERPEEAKNPQSLLRRIAIVVGIENNWEEAE